MPYYYYLKPEEPDKSSEPKINFRIYKKPTPCDLLLPSVHVSRGDNTLLVDSDAQQAVEALLKSCNDTDLWPSLAVQNNVDENNTTDLQATNRTVELEVEEERSGALYKSQEILARAAASDKHRPHLNYETLEPNMVEAARDLFCERQRRKALYEVDPNWAPSKVPSEYELFTAWAVLPRSEKISYITEVNGSVSSSSSLPSNYVETQRAVRALYNSCPDSRSWPSVQYCQAQTRQQPSLPPPRINSFLINPPILPYKFE